jgi:multiple sugar transport system permease protein
VQQSALAPPSSSSFEVRYSRWQRKNAPYLFISPFFILFAIFGLFPTLFSLFVSFQRWDAVSGLGGMKFTGIDNYQYVLTDTFFWKSLKNTVFIALASGIPQHLIAIPLAFVIHTALKRVKSVLLTVHHLGCRDCHRLPDALFRAQRRAELGAGRAEPRAPAGFADP